MGRFVKVIGIVIGLASVWTQSVQALTVVKPLEGYACMGLKSDKEFNDWVPGLACQARKRCRSTGVHGADGSIQADWFRIFAGYSGVAAK